MNRNYIETIVGFFVLVVAIFFAYNAYIRAGISQDESDGYHVNANFDRIDGLNVGGDVKISGLKVGTVASAVVDPETYQAKVQLAIDNNIKVPDDSSAEIISAGLLGDKYIAIVPGGSEDYLKEGGKINFTQSSVSLEALIGKFMFGSSDKKKEEESKEEAKKSTF